MARRGSAGRVANGGRPGIRTIRDEILQRRVTAGRGGGFSLSEIAERRVQICGLKQIDRFGHAGCDLVEARLQLSEFRRQVALEFLSPPKFS